MGCSSSNPETVMNIGRASPGNRGQQANIAASRQKITDMAPKEILDKYINLGKKIRELEKSNLPRALQVKESTFKRQVDHCHALSKLLEERVAKTRIEKSDVQQFKASGLCGLLSTSATLAIEQAEYVEALNNEEIARQDFKEAERQKAEQQATIEKLKQAVEESYKVYEEQEDLLSELFGGEYGSKAENVLEKKYDLLVNQKQRIQIAKYKWDNTRVLIQYAANQLAFSIMTWINVIRSQSVCLASASPVDPYQLATMVRDNLVAALQNLATAQRYLMEVRFPYCSQRDMDTLEMATRNIYADMQIRSRHTNSLNIFNAAHKRIEALLAWFDHVIHAIIMADEARVKKALQLADKELKTERLMLIREKIKQTYGVELDTISETAPTELPKIEPERESMVELLAKTGADGEDEVQCTSKARMSTSIMMPDGITMAESPSADELFGNIESIKKQYQEDIAEFNRQQNLNRVRAEQGLQEKLTERRHHRLTQHL